ncbi:MAG: hypothetical protein GX886_02930, partial [Comamonadaceae bacterium]|nr:hypothetical protein [Comamonadaceae bacterium]
QLGQPRGQGAAVAAKAAELAARLLDRAVGLFDQHGEADVIAAQKTNLYDIAPRLPGSDVLDGRPAREEQAFAVPKGRDAAGLAYLRSFVQDAKDRGLVQRAIDRVGIRGVRVAP